MRVLALSTLLLAAMDHWTTYLCLRAPVSGWTVSEANPLAAWLFSRIGLIPGLFLDSTITLAAVGFLLVTPRFPDSAKLLFFGFVSAWTGYAVVNNLGALSALGLSPLGWS